jgi:hypothetical protein
MIQAPKLWRRRRLSIQEVVLAIVAENERIREFWSKAHGWAPRDAADLLSRSRLDRQVSLSHCLRMWIETADGEGKDGRLIFAWANLGCLVEGTMKFLLSVYLLTYRKNPCRKWGQVADPDVLGLEELRRFYISEKVWTPDQEKKWDSWIERIQQRRNAIHAYKDREIGTRSEFLRDVRRYLEFVQEIASRAPEPDCY